MEELRGGRINHLITDDVFNIDLSDFYISLEQLYPEFNVTSNHYTEPKTEWEELIEVLE